MIKSTKYNFIDNVGILRTPPKTIYKLRTFPNKEYAEPPSPLRNCTILIKNAHSAETNENFSDYYFSNNGQFCTQSSSKFYQS